MSDVIVIGAGVAGLSAALRLVENGLSVTIVEARDRVGGRIMTEHVAGCDVELGAEFIHGLPEDTLALLKRYGLKHYELDGDALVYDGLGNLRKQHEDAAEDQSPFELLERMTAWSETHPHSDMTFAEWMAKEDVSPDAASGATAYVEGFNAADSRVIGVRGLAVQQRAEDAMDGDRLFHVEGGYSQLPEAMAAELRRNGVEFVFNYNVASVKWSAARVEVESKGGRAMTSRAAVVTLPLAVMQRRGVSFVPPLASQAVDLSKLRMGAVVRVSMIFKSRWWASRGWERMSFLFPEKRNSNDGTSRFEVFWTPHPDKQPMITAWAGGVAGERFEGLPGASRCEIAVESLAGAMGVDVAYLHEELVTARTHNWHADEYARNAYSYVPAGAAEVMERLAQPVGGALFLAGEHTEPGGNWATVHGALRSGVRAARQVVNTLESAK